MENKYTLTKTLEESWIAFKENDRKAPVSKDSKVSILFREMKQIFINELSLDKNFIIKSSVGKGSHSHIAWLAIMNSHFTTSPTKSFYTIFQFDDSGLYLCTVSGGEQVKKILENLKNKEEKTEYKINFKNKTKEMIKDPKYFSFNQIKYACPVKSTVAKFQNSNVCGIKINFNLTDEELIKYINTSIDFSELLNKEFKY